MNLFLTVASFLFIYISLTSRRQAFYLLAALLPTYLLRATIFGIPTNLFEVFVGILLIVGLAQSHIRKSWQIYWQNLPFGFRTALILFMLATIISTAISIHPRVSLGILKGWIFIPIIFSFMVASEVKNRQQIIFIFQSLILSGVIVSLVGISQLGTLTRIKSIYDVPNSLALFIAPLISACLWFGIIKRYYFFLAASVIMTVALLATQSVSGVIGVVISLAIGTLIWGKKNSQRRYFMAGIACLLLVFVFIFWQNGKISYLLSSFQGSHPATSATVRLQLWSISWQLIKQHPLLGVGLGQFEPYYQQILHQRFSDQTLKPIPEFVLRDPHNWLLAFYLNLGPAGLAAFIAISAYSLKSATKTNQDPLKQALTLSLITILIYGLTDTVYWKNDLSTQYWLIIFLLLSTRLYSNSDPVLA